MKQPVRFKLPRPKTFAMQLLLLILMASIIPLLGIGVMVWHTTRLQFNAFSVNETQMLESNFTHVYSTYLEEQVNSIDLEMQKVEIVVQLARSLAEHVFSASGSITPLTMVYDRSKNVYREAENDNQGSVVIPGADKPDLGQLEDLARSKALFPIFKQEVDRNRNIAVMYYIHPKSGSYDYPLYSALNAVQQNPRPLTSYSFYTDALSIGVHDNRVAWTEPYYDMTTPLGWMFTATAPVFDNEDRLRGIVAADVTIDKFVQNMMDTRFKSKKAYAFLLDRKGGLIAVQSQGRNEIGVVLQDGFQPPARNGRTVTVGGVDKLLFGKTIPSTGWLLGYVIPRDELLQPVTASSEKLMAATSSDLLQQISLLSVVAILISVVISIFLWSRISLPLKKLSHAFADIGKGNFAELQNDGAQEFTSLLQAFNRMSAKIKELIEEQTLLNGELERKVEHRTVQLKEINEELQLRVNELLRMEKWRNNLYMNISHDIKTPLTLVNGYIDAILDGTIAASHATDYLRRVQDRILAINRLVKNLNDLGQLETGQIQPKLRPINADEFFVRYLHEWQSSLGLENRRLMVTICDRLGPLYADPDMLMRVIDNLLDNARKYSPEGSEIRTDVRRVANDVVFSVANSGIGIPTTSLPYVFDSFYRVDKSRNSKISGSGLGLSIAREIVTLHRGKIWIDPSPHGGSMFSVSIPVSHEIKNYKRQRVNEKKKLPIPLQKRSIGSFFSLSATLLLLLDVNTVIRALQRKLGAANIDVMLLAFQALLGALLGKHSTVKIDICRQLRAFGQDNDLILAHFNETAANGDDVFLAALLDTDRSDLQRRNERDMVWQYAKLPL
ncbi:hypothetical protein VN24_08230 [Paenibacillus beijingensis]|uniref:histidine kinase n=1 Tax=Paenibacillus beijingensis TaxID=1126833 RepID=A0A0D5NGN2_9BACL|nr:hypothetical protein VN24_08230 [Paenibacillus beijingensis]